MISLVRVCKACWGAAHVRKDPAHWGGADAQQISISGDEEQERGNDGGPSPV